MSILNKLKEKYEKKMRYINQRVKRGYSDLDLANGCIFITDFVCDMCQYFLDHPDNLPMHFVTKDFRTICGIRSSERAVRYLWSETLKEILWAFRMHKKLVNLDILAYSPKHKVKGTKMLSKKEIERYENGMILLVKNLHNFWS